MDIVPGGLTSYHGLKKYVLFADSVKEHVYGENQDTTIMSFEFDEDYLKTWMLTLEDLVGCSHCKVY